ncbi:MAG: hypothetical protein M3198_00105 [Actinomycetota bacterium]|nr:hypothetical protein [Actinomycetota bacterium]
MSTREPAARGKERGTKPSKVRQAVVMVHGMGEQRPLQTLNQFIAAALEPDPEAEHDFYSRPDEVTDSYEARVYLAPRSPRRGDPEKRAQTEFYEYHWAHLMQGNRLDDMWPTFKKMLLQRPTRVPSGLRVVWVLFWVLLMATVFFLWKGDVALGLDKLTFEGLLRALFGGGAIGVALTYLVARLMPGWITTSFVDVVRYLDTSPRSYDVRRQIRKGMVDLLVKLHEAELCGKQRYDRIIVVAHSLGAFIAYDGISYLFSHIDQLLSGDQHGTGVPDGLKELEEVSSKLPDASYDDKAARVKESIVDEYRAAQRRLWLGIRAHGNPFRITDFVTLGTPMYFTDRLFTKNVNEFKVRIDRGELPTCPPQNDSEDDNNIHGTERWFSWANKGRRELDHKAVFAVTRWTNMWFPARLGFFGDWFGGRLAPLFGNGIKDIALKGNSAPPKSRLIPGYAHALYLQFPTDTTEASVTTKLRSALELASTDWLQPTADDE